MNNTTNNFQMCSRQSKNTIALINCSVHINAPAGDKKLL